MSPDINRLPINPQIFDMKVTKLYADVVFKGKYEGQTFGEARPALKKAYEDATSAQGIPFDDKRALETVSALQYYFKATLVDPNQQLHSAWVAIVKAYKDGKITKEQFEQLKDELTAPIEFKDPETGKTVTFTEDYAKSINDKIVKDRNFQDQLVQEWRQGGAIDKYNKVLQDLKKLTG